MHRKQREDNNHDPACRCTWSTCKSLGETAVPSVCGNSHNHRHFRIAPVPAIRHHTLLSDKELIDICAKLEVFFDLWSCDSADMRSLVGINAQASCTVPSCNRIARASDHAKAGLRQQSLFFHDFLGLAERHFDFPVRRALPDEGHVHCVQMRSVVHFLCKHRERQSDAHTLPFCSTANDIFVLHRQLPGVEDRSCRHPDKVQWSHRSGHNKRQLNN